MLKNFFRGLSSSLLFTLLLLTLLGATTVLTIRPENIKSWLAKSDIYTLLPDVLLDQAKQEKDNDLGVPLSDAGVRTAAKEAFSPKYLQASTEGFIDSMGRWLDGKTDKPDFSIDIKTPKDQFAQNVAEYAQKRYQSLPTCASGTVPSTADLLLVDCQPAAGIDVPLAKQELQAKVANSKDFFAQPTLTADTLESDSPQDSVFTKRTVPTAYSWVQRLPIVLAVLALLNAVIVIFTSQSRRVGVKRVATAMIVVGIIASFGVWASSLALGELNRSASNSTGEWSAIIKNLAASSTYAMQRDVLKVGLALAGGTALVGAIIMLFMRITNKEVKEKSGTASTDVSPRQPTPEPAPATKPRAPSTQAKPKTAPLLKPKQQPKPTVVRPTSPVGSSSKLIQ